MPASYNRDSPALSPPVVIGVIVLVLAIVAFFGYRTLGTPAQKPTFTAAPFGGPGTSDPTAAQHALPPGMTPQGMTANPPGAPATRQQANPYGGVSTFTGR